MSQKEHFWFLFNLIPNFVISCFIRDGLLEPERSARLFHVIYRHILTLVVIKNISVNSFLLDLDLTIFIL